VPLSGSDARAAALLWAHGVVLVLITFVPALSNWLPHVLGFK
jgi:hypothetical protein